MFYLLEWSYSPLVRASRLRKQLSGHTLNVEQGLVVLAVAEQMDV